MIRYLNNNSLIVVLMLILFSATSAAAATAVIDKAPPSLSVQRQLVWDGPGAVTPCDAATVARLEVLFNLGLLEYEKRPIFSCTKQMIQWDPDSILNVEMLQAISFYKPYTFYNPIYDGNKLCQSGDFCATSTEDFNLYQLYDEYAYDCSNVYCGPNAIRDCAGNLMTVPCTDSLVSLPEIPSNELVNCLKDRQLSLALFANQIDVYCDECTADENGWFTYWCVVPCYDCYKDGSGNSICLTDISVFRTFVPQKGTTGYCETVGSAGTYCISTFHTAKLLDTQLNTLDYFSSECTAEWNGVSCTCSVCGVGVWGPLVIVDCSTDGVALAYDQCSMTSSGVYAGIYNPELQLGSDSCPSRASTNGNDGSAANPETMTSSGTANADPSAANANDGSAANLGTGPSNGTANADPSAANTDRGKEACAVLVYVCVGATFFLFT
ncbi:hypothetical protein FRACYDRAFT_245799 [Fragilariopsis cylindrus CCMP1102]|uniref:Uncharacterized protein n=1 Tax=Fragilariopsis cylindrus CCMP1102 TaxID=635003 RepID=A0A1E7EZM2_9STRA|nr:hypothetical protein FRACYDRAFT_245799 [Fragilariopsis cylindrus CCMP1102]|eukprot:OEU11371.1 hypothetical protein FRACYDRAFT_245799 [Fragilariopsis cylindrus CCMP1102]